MRFQDYAIKHLVASWIQHLYFSCFLKSIAAFIKFWGADEDAKKLLSFSVYIRFSLNAITFTWVPCLQRSVNSFPMHIKLPLLFLVQRRTEGAVTVTVTVTVDDWRLTVHPLHRRYEDCNNVHRSPVPLGIEHWALYFVHANDLICSTTFPHTIIRVQCGHTYRIEDDSSSYCYLDECAWVWHVETIGTTFYFLSYQKTCLIVDYGKGLKERPS